MKHIIITGLFLLVFCIVNGQNYALTFDGQNDYVNLGSNAGSDIRSIELWFNPYHDIPSTNPDRKALVMRNSDLGGDEFGIYIGHDFLGEQGRITFTREIDSVFHYVYSNENSWEGGNWVHVAITIDSLSGIKMYIDGVLQDDASNINTAIPSSSRETMLGCWGDKYIRWFEGSIDEVRFWTRTLSADEIIDHMCDTLFNHQNEGLWGYWNMNEGSGSTLVNYGEEGTNGTIEGCVYQADTLCPSFYIDEPMLRNAIKIYPNPVENVSQLVIDQYQSGIGRLEIYDSRGLLIDHYDFDSDPIHIFRKDHPSGIYFYTLKLDNKIYSGKLVFK